MITQLEAVVVAVAQKEEPAVNTREEELREALQWCLNHTDGHAVDCNLNQQSRWDEAQQALSDCAALPEASVAQAEISAKRNQCTCGYWEGLKKAEKALAATVPEPVTDANPDIREIAFDFVGDLGLPEHRSKEYLGQRTEWLIQRIVSVVNKYRAAAPSEGEKRVMDKLDQLAAEIHWVYQAEAKRQGDVRHPERYADLPENIKQYDRVLAKFILERQSQRDHELILRGVRAGIEAAMEACVEGNTGKFMEANIRKSFSMKLSLLNPEALAQQIERGQ